MKIKKEELIQLWRELDQLNKGVYPIKFSYFIAQNRKLIKGEVDILIELSKSPKEYMVYDNKRVNSAKELSDKDDNGEPVIQNNAYVITKNFEEFKKQMEALKEEYKPVIEEAEIRLKEFQTILGEPFDFDGFKVKIEHFPDKIKPELIEIFMKLDLIEE